MEAPSAQRTAPQARHVRFRCRLVKEDKPLRGEATLSAPPDPPCLGDIGSGLLVGTERLFLYVIPMSASA